VHGFLPIVMSETDAIDKSFGDAIAPTFSVTERRNRPIGL
jgi:hypothetical protein